MMTGLAGGEVHPWSRSLGEWSTMIGYKMCSSPARVCTMAKAMTRENQHLITDEPVEFEK